MIIIKCKQCGQDVESKYPSRIRQFCSRECADLYRGTKVIEICINCGKEFETTRNKCCSDKCSREYRKNSGSMKKNGFWFENGYKVLYVEGNGSIKEHIKVVEENIGRKLNKNELVHHINENRLDNRLENLKLMTRGEHSSYHRKLEIEKGKHLFNRRKEGEEK